MRNVLLIIWGMLIVGGLGFFFGRYSVLRNEAPVSAAAPQSAGTRARNGEPSHTVPAAAPPVDTGVLQSRNLLFPVPGVKAPDVLDTFDDQRGSDRIHEATDIMAPHGTPVVAVDDGLIRKFFLSVAGGNTIYQFDPAEKYCYYYAHLDRYATGLGEGARLRRGDTIGYVGTTGNAAKNAPHLHFAIFELGPEKEWWKGTPINPYPILIRALGH